MNEKRELFLRIVDNVFLGNYEGVTPGVIEDLNKVVVYKIKEDNNLERVNFKYFTYIKLVESKIEPLGKIHIKFEAVYDYEQEKKDKETKERVDKLGEIAELYKEQIEAVSLIQKQLETIIKKHDGFNIDVDVVINNKIKEKLDNITKNLTELGS